jgi:hypothetical protein
VVRLWISAAKSSGIFSVTSIALPLSVKEYIGSGDERWFVRTRDVSDQRKIRAIRFSRVRHFHFGCASGDQPVAV